MHLKEEPLVQYDRVQVQVQVQVLPHCYAGFFHSVSIILWAIGSVHYIIGIELGGEVGVLYISQGRYKSTSCY